ncbi:iron chelate uptake ABC transporter family permease subunit [Corynebacterium sp. CCM 9185]|uniref:Iron chelate uptake ABC transporter family permease subunit n=1 Tax=Corynebacterium marambiense TaxID=2765364 RepID=A0ABS0VYB9_9CORY|nr:iron chelate uptake ABC transporter family permease subunit [Corynebacterium marambiense]MBI9000605.1 iron chelate uptake ABC transporter family permease subunit [Corynebacterium marambiense]MCK7663132.1 iron chelate uptake ABC transporter family permease subunit [Corynebacterium marambiense]MCX7542746.1 iron chelate uptake ABC transporter family permease subunit [Corynebacterium marambiense]
MSAAETTVPNTPSLAGEQHARRGRADRFRRLLVAGLILLSVLGIAFFLTWDLPSVWKFALKLRVSTVAGLVIVGVAIGASTVVFQTITANKILTPALMGFDSLYLLVQTVIVYWLGSMFFSTVPSAAMFLVNTVIMVGFSLLLFGTVFAGGRTSIDLLLLIGIVTGVFFRSLSALLQRMLDPGEYQVLQDVFFATFSVVDKKLLPWAGLVTIVCVGIFLYRRRQLDVLLLGRDTAVSLGVNHRREVITALVICSVLVSVSTSLVGPVTFFGLLVANLAYLLVRSDRHGWTIPAASALGVVFLVVGQWVLGRLFSFDTSLSVIIEFAGGLLFLYLLLSKKGLGR